MTGPTTGQSSDPGEPRDHDLGHGHAHHAPQLESDAGNAHEGGHDKHAGHTVAMFRDRFWISLLLTVPVVYFSPMVQEWFGYTARPFRAPNGWRRSSARSSSSTAGRPS